MRGTTFISCRNLHAFADSVVTIDDIIAERDKVGDALQLAVHRRVWEVEPLAYRWQFHRQTKRCGTAGITIHRMADGKLVDNWSEWTKLELALQLGAISGTVPASSKVND